jgi:DNA-binding NarL/FixJ family response regulator
MPVDGLLVDSNQSDTLLIKNAAQEYSSDVRITVAKDAATAIVLLFDPGFKPRLVIASMDVPNRVNNELLQRAEAKGVPVVVFSSALPPREVADLLKAGVRECVPKPMAWEEFQHAVVGIFSRWTAGWM